MALGALPRQIQRQFLLLALRLLAAGIAAGIAGAWVVGRAMETMLYKVSSFDVKTLVAAGAILGGVALAACLLPSGRAARISPVEALAGD